MVSDKTIHKAFRIQKTQTKPIRENFHFHFLPKLYIGINATWLFCYYVEY